MKIWVDLANSPHVGFFVPLMKKFSEQGHQCFVTLRDFSQTVELARQNGIDGLVIGKHGGGSTIGKVSNLVARSMSLWRYAKPMHFDVAVSHNSYPQIMGARACGIRAVTLMDYEGQPANHLAFRFAHRVIVPECFPQSSLEKSGACPSKVRKYDGFKEQVYLSDFKPDDGFIKELVDACDLPPEWTSEKTVLVTVRTPATMAAYHRFENALFDKLVETLNNRPELTVVLLPRVREQKEELRKRLPNLLIPKRSLDGGNLVYHSDLVISAGGTMNREAAILGTPAYTIFAGKIPAVDQRLIEMERMVALLSEGDLDRIEYRKKPYRGFMRNPTLINEIAKEIVP